MNTREKFDVIFQHLIDLPLCHCVFASTREKVSGRNRLFLFLHNKNQVFKRDPLKNVWHELMEEDADVQSLRNNFLNEIERRRIPCYQASDLDVFSLNA